MKYRISAAADSDFDDIWLYTDKNWSLEQARTYYNLILDKIEYLAVNPSLGRIVSFGGKSYRCSQIESHVIFYRETSANHIEVIRILHKRMNIEDRLSE